jgi:uncharacterized membrane protein YccF (DUF307 family)
MLDNLLILFMGGIATCVIFLVAGLIAKWKGWE